MVEEQLVSGGPHEAVIVEEASQIVVVESRPEVLRTPVPELGKLKDGVKFFGRSVGLEVWENVYCVGKLMAGYEAGGIGLGCKVQGLDLARPCCSPQQLLDGDQG